MMMPANYSAIAENEMTYVVGGGLIDAIGAVTAPVWTAANVKTFNTNLIQIVGNEFVPTFLKSTLGVMFGGSWGEKVNDKKTAKNFIFGKDGALYTNFDKTPNDKSSFLNKAMAGVGLLSAVYTLGTAPTKSYVAEKIIVTDGTAL